MKHRIKFATEIDKSGLVRHVNGDWMHFCKILRCLWCVLTLTFGSWLYFSSSKYKQSKFWKLSESARQMISITSINLSYNLNHVKHSFFLQYRITNPRNTITPTHSPQLKIRVNQHNQSLSRRLIHETQNRKWHRCMGRKLCLHLASGFPVSLRGKV